MDPSTIMVGLVGIGLVALIVLLCVTAHNHRQLQLTDRLRRVKSLEAINHNARVQKLAKQSSVTPRQLMDARGERKLGAVEIFRLYDKDRSGFVERHELTKLFFTIGFTAEHAEEAYDIIDESGDGKVSEEEFLAFYDILYAKHPTGPSDSAVLLRNSTRGNEHVLTVEERATNVSPPQNSQKALRSSYSGSRDDEEVAANEDADGKKNKKHVSSNEWVTSYVDRVISPLPMPPPNKRSPSKRLWSARSMMLAYDSDQDSAAEETASRSPGPPPPPQDSSPKESGADVGTALSRGILHSLDARSMDAWEKFVDPKSGKAYYHNRSSGLSQWSPPFLGAPNGSSSGHAQGENMNEQHHDRAAPGDEPSAPSPAP